MNKNSVGKARMCFNCKYEKEQVYLGEHCNYCFADDKHPNFIRKQVKKDDKN